MLGSIHIGGQAQCAKCVLRGDIGDADRRGSRRFAHGNACMMRCVLCRGLVRSIPLILCHFLNRMQSAVDFLLKVQRKKNQDESSNDVGRLRKSFRFFCFFSCCRYTLRRILDPSDLGGRGDGRNILIGFHDGLLLFVWANAALMQMRRVAVVIMIVTKPADVLVVSMPTGGICPTGMSKSGDAERRDDQKEEHKKNTVFFTSNFLRYTPGYIH